VLRGLQAHLEAEGDDEWRRTLLVGYVVSPTCLPSASLALLDLPGYAAAHLRPHFSRFQRPNLDARRADPVSIIFDGAWARRRDARAVLDELVRERGPLGRLLVAEAAVAFGLGLLPGQTRPEARAWLASYPALASAWAGRFRWAAGHQDLGLPRGLAAAALRAAVASAMLSMAPLARAVGGTGWGAAYRAALAAPAGGDAGDGAHAPANSVVPHGVFAHLASLVSASGASPPAARAAPLLELVPRLFDAASGLRARVPDSSPLLRGEDVPEELEPRLRWELAVAWAVVARVLEAGGFEPGPFRRYLVYFYAGSLARAAPAWRGRRAGAVPPRVSALVAAHPAACAWLAEAARGWVALQDVRSVDLGAPTARAQVAALRARPVPPSPADGCLLWCGVCWRVRVCVEEGENHVSRRFRVHEDYSRLATHAHRASRENTVSGLSDALYRLRRDPGDPADLLARVTCGDRGTDTGERCNATELSGASLLGRAVSLGGRTFRLCVACGGVFRLTRGTVWSGRAGGPVCLPCSGPALTQTQRARDESAAAKRARRLAQVAPLRPEPEQGPAPRVVRRPAAPSRHKRMRLQLGEITGTARGGGVV